MKRGGGRLFPVKTFFRIIVVPDQRGQTVLKLINKVHLGCLNFKNFWIKCLGRALWCYGLFHSGFDSIKEIGETFY